MSKDCWEKISELKHHLDRVRSYQTDSILRMKIAVDSLKEMQETLENIIMEIDDDPEKT